MNFLFACGGSAGHINPALSIAGEIRRIMPDAKILFVGSGKRMECRLVPLAGFELKNIKMSGITRGFAPSDIVKNLVTIKNLMASGTQAARILREFRPDAVIGTGGYVCYPVLKKAAGMRIPTIVHESNAIPGLTTKMLSGCVDKVLVAFPGLENRYRIPERVIVTGTPVRKEFSVVSKEQARRALKLDERPLVVSFWGSLGAARMNEAMAEFIDLNSKSGMFNHIHATGGGDAGLIEMKRLLRERGAPVELPRGIDIRAYIDDMPSVMAAAELVLCRAGALTLAELTLIGKPAVLVPSPYVPNNHQEENAKKLEAEGGAIMLTERGCTGRALYGTVAELISDRSRLKKMAAAQRKLAFFDASERIVELIISICH